MDKTRFLAAAVVVCGTVSESKGLGQGWVVLSIPEYEKLHAEAYPAPPEPAGPPVAATLTRVDYNLRVEGAVATGSALLTIDVLSDGWVQVPIPPGLLVRQARLGADLVPLIPLDRGRLAAVLSKKGRSVLTLDVAFTVSANAGEQRISLPVGASGITRAEIALAQPDVDVKVLGGLPPEKPAEHWVTYAAGAAPLIFQWRKRIEERRVEQPLRMRGTLTQVFGLGEDSTSLRAEVQFEVLQGAARQVKIAVPDTVTINQVPGALVADWVVEHGELLVDLLDPVEHSAAFTISGETRLARDGALAIPLLRLEDVERETGGVAVEVLGAGEIKKSTTAGLFQVEAAELGPMVAARESPSLAAFRPVAGPMPRTLQVEVVRYTQQAVLTANVEEARYRALMTPDGKTLVQAHSAVRNNQRDFAKITLPSGETIWSVAVSGKPVRPGIAPDGGVLIPLDKSRAGEEAPLLGVEIVYLARGQEWGVKGRANLALPAMDLPISRTGVTLYYPPLFRVSPEPGAFRPHPYEQPVSAILNGSARLASQPMRACVDLQRKARRKHWWIATAPAQTRAGERRQRRGECHSLPWVRRCS